MFLLKIDQLVINGLGSYDDFEANISERKVSQPKKKSIKETVPFSNHTHDFSAINGEIYWEERTLEYVFEITACSPEKLEEKKRHFLAWVMNVMEEDIVDPFMNDYHFRGTFENVDVDDSEIEKSTITVTFSAYPYKIADYPKLCICNITKAEKSTVKIMNESSHRVIPKFISDVPFTVWIKNSSFAFVAGEVEVASIKLDVGVNTLIFQSTGDAGTVKVEFYEEVF